jgi:deoxyribodipyrimidine photo-lyase
MLARCSNSAALCPWLTLATPVGMMEAMIASTLENEFLVNITTTQATREAVAAELAVALDGLYSGPPTISPIVGGRREARNSVVKRGVSVLSPYLRHGVLGLAEVRDYIVTRFDAARGGVAKFVNELGWRAFYQLVYRDLGRGVEQDIEVATHGQRRSQGLPPDIATGSTQLRCIDESLNELFAQGYMHNHARMWFASYLQHHRQIDWREGANLLYTHLLDGDPASNNLSWQWVGGTFSHKPYIFNKDNVYRFSDGHYCRNCPSLATCPFDDTYEGLALRLFGRSQEELERGYRPRDGRKGQHR